MDTMICTYVSEISEIVAKLKNKTAKCVSRATTQKEGGKVDDSS